MFELHTKTKIYQTNKETYELAERKLRVRPFLRRLSKKICCFQDAEKEISKLEKEIKPEKREKTKKYTNAQKQLKNRHIRHEDTHGLAIKVTICLIADLLLNIDLVTT